MQIIWSPVFKRWVIITVAAEPEAKAKPNIKIKLEYAKRQTQGIKTENLQYLLALIYVPLSTDGQPSLLSCQKSPNQCHDKSPLSTSRITYP
jgi:hypothetical protein